MCLDAQQIENIRIIRYEDSIYYANAEDFGHAIFKKLNIKLDKTLKQLNNSLLQNKNDTTLTKPIDNEFRVEKILSVIGFRHLILDFSCVNTVDLMGVNAILQVNKLISCLEN